MRILYVGRNAKIGGGSTFRFNIARGLMKRGHQAWVACTPGEMLPRYRAAGIQHVWTPPAPLGGPWIAHAIKKYGIDLVHASNATPGKAAEWACLRTDTPMVMSVHGLLGKNDHHASCLQTALRIMTFEEVAVKSLESRGTIDMSKVTLLRRPIEHRPQFPKDDGEFRIVGVGRMSKRKGQNALNLIKAFAKFREKVPNSSLKLLGDGSCLGEVKKAGREYNRSIGEDRVDVLGAVPEPGPIVGGAHVLVGASYCALEAIMQGVGVIAAGFWGYGIIDEDNLRDAMKWNFGDVGGKWEMTPENFLEALHHMHTAWTENRDRERYWRLDRFIEEDHALDRVAGRIEAIYNDVLRLTPAGTPVAALG